MNADPLTQPKVAVIGAGPGGYEAAIRLNQYEIPSILFEKERLGGVCLNWGCIPTKALVRSAELIHEMNAAVEYGIKPHPAVFDFKDIQTRKNKVVEQIVSGIELLIRKRKIPVINSAVISVEKGDRGFILTTTGGEQYGAEFVIIATGSIPQELQGVEADETNILTSTGMLALNELPKELVIIGGGVIGCEFASIFNALGVQVTIMEYLPRLVSTEDEEISKRLMMALKKSGIRINLSLGVESALIHDGKVRLMLSDGSELETEKVLLSVGRKPVCDLDWIGGKPETNKGFIVINEKMLTSLDGVYAIGDVTGKMLLAHTASKQGLLVAEQIKATLHDKEALHHNLIYSNIPRCTFTYPEVGSVGLTESEAKEQYGEIITGRFPFTANGKAVAMNNSFGFVKTIARTDNQQLVGMHIIGPHAAELIAQGALLIGFNATAEDIERVVFAHPTLSEAIMESVEDIRSLSIHKI